MAGYARQSSSSIADGEVITAAPLNSEFDALLAAFAFSGGHNHDGTSTEGAYVGLIADVDALNKIVVDTSNNRHGFFVEVSSSAVEQIRIQDGAIVPVTDSDIDLGTSSLEFKDLYIDGTAYIDTLEVHVGATLSAGVLTLPDGSASAPVITNASDTNQGLYFSGTDEMSFTAGGTAQVTFADGAIKPVTDNDIDLGTSSLEFKNLYIDGTANIDTLAATTMSGDLAMGSNKVTGLAAPTADGDAARKAYVDDSISTAEGLTQLAGNINVNGFYFYGSSGEDIKFQPVGSASLLATQDNDGEFVALVLRNESDAADTTGIASLRFDLEDTGGNTVDAAKIAVKKEQSFTATASTQDAKIVFSTSLNGTLTEYLALTSAGALVPVTDNTVDIGTSSAEIKDIYVDGTAYLDAIGFGTTSITLPTSDGSANQILKTNGSGTLSWADDSQLSGAVTSVTSMLNASLVVGRDADNDIDFGTDNTIIFRADGADQVKITNGAILPVTDDDIDLGSGTAQFKDGYFDGTVEADAITVGGVTLAETIADTAGAMFSSNTETGVTVTYQDSDNTIDVEIDAAQTTITSLLATDIKIGEDDQTKIDFETADEIHFYAANVEQVYLADNIFGPQTDSDVDLGTTGVRWKDAYVDSVTVTDNVTVGGDLTVNGTTTTVNSTTVTIDDPIFTLGGDTAPGSDDNKDRGIEFRYHTGSAAKVGFFGYDDSAGAFTFIPDATNSSEVFSGTAGNVAFGNIAGTLTTAAQTNITSVGALDGGSITSNFGTIDTGASNITTTGLISGGSLDIDNVLINGTTIGHTDDTDLLTLANGSLTVAGTIEGTTITASTALVPDASGGADLGTTSLEWGDLYIADDKKIYLGSDQNFSIEYDEDGNDTTAVVAANGVSFAPHGSSSGNGTELRFQELAANGANYVGFKAPDSISSNEVWVLPNADGSANQVLKTDGSNALGWADAPAGGEMSFVADGAIAAQKPVILTSAGKAQQVAETTTADSTLTLKQITDMDGSDTATDYVATTYEASSERYVMAYRDTSNSNYITMVAGSWSDGTVTWGTPFVAASHASRNEPSLDSADGHVALFYGLGDNSQASLRVYSISGTTFTSTTAQTVYAGATAGEKVAYVPSSAFSSSPYDPVCGIVCCIYSHSGSGTAATYVRSYTIRVSNGNDEGKTTEESILATNAHMDRADMVADPDNGKAIYATFDGSDGDVGKAVVIGFGGTASSPTDTVGTFVDYSGSDDADYTSICYDTQNNKVFVAWKNDDGSNPQVKGAIGTVTAGTNAISFAGTATIWDGAGGQSQFDVAFDTDNNKIGFFYRDDDNSDILTHKIITPGASSFSVANGATMSNGDVYLHSNSATYGSGKGFLVGLNDRSDSNKVAYATGYFATSTSSNLDNGNYLGVAKAAISDTATGTIVVPGGLSAGHSSLTVGNHYFTNGNGVVGLVGSTTGEQYLGRATSTTEIQLLENEGYLYGTANGAITAGKPIQVRSDGDFEMISETAAAAGSSRQLDADDGNQNILASCHMSGVGSGVQTVVTLYEDQGNSNYLTVVATTVSDSDNTTLSSGTPVQVVADTADGGDICFDPDTDRFIVAHRGGSSSLQPLAAYVGSVSGTTISIGSAQNSSSSGSIDARDSRLTYDEDTDRLIGLYYDQSDSGKVYYVVGTVTGGTTNSISWGTRGTVYAGGSNTALGFVYDSTNDKAVTVFNANGDQYGVVGTVTGGTTNSISWGSTATLQNGHRNGNHLVHDVAGGEGKTYSKSRNSSTNYLAVLTLSGTTPSLGTVLSHSDNNSQTDANHHTIATYATNKFVQVAEDGGNDLNLIPYTVSGTDITKGTTIEISDNENPSDMCITSVGSNTLLITRSAVTADELRASAYRFSSSNIADDGESYIGIATKTVADDAQAEVATFGQIDAQQSGLTAGQKYFVQTDGTVGTTAATPSVVAGKALSATKLLISE